MYIWTLLAIVVGVTVLIFHIILFFGLFIKAWNSKSNSMSEPAEVTASPSTNMCVTDPFSGKLVNLERVSNASSLRSSRSVGFIAYDRSDSSLSRGKVKPLFFNGSVNSEKLNRAITSTACSSEMEMTPIKVNPLFKKELYPEARPGKIHAREIYN